MDEIISGLSQKELVAYRYIRNELVHYGHAPSVRDVMKQLESKAPRSAELVINSLMERGLITRRKNTGKLQLMEDKLTSAESVRTINLPLVGHVAAGTPILAEENVEAYISVDGRLISDNARDYYLLRVHGNSMNLRGINDGDLVIVRAQPSANPGQSIVALINDEATIKEFVPAGDKIILRPHSADKTIQPIILSEDFTIQGIVAGVVPYSQLQV